MRFHRILILFLGEFLSLLQVPADLLNSSVLLEPSLSELFA
jgi:hypothetical protein